MPSTYTGSDAGRTAHESIAIPCPVGADAPNAASVNNPLQALANFLAYLSTNAALKGAIETARFDGAAGDANAALESGGAITIRKLVWALTYPTKKVRFYQRAGGELEIVFNAEWRPGTTDWTADSFVAAARPLDIAKVIVGGTGLKVYRPAASVGSNAWADSAWELTHNLADDGGLKFIMTTTGAGGSNPAATEAIVNEVRAKNTTKSWGFVTVAAGVVTVRGGFNVKGAALTVGNDAVKVELATPLASADFGANVTDDGSVAGSSNTDGVAPRVTAKSKDGGSSGVAYFSVSYPNVADLSTGNWAFNFSVDGQQDS